MLLAVGVYPQFISAVAEVTTFRFSPPVLLLLACVGAGAAGAIAGGAGVIGTLLDHYPSTMYSLFIGLTLGGIPILWRMVQPLDRSVIGSAAVAVALMVLLAATDPGRTSSGTSSDATVYAMLAIAGFSGGAAMILPGVPPPARLRRLSAARPRPVSAHCRRRRGRRRGCAGWRRRRGGRVPARAPAGRGRGGTGRGLREQSRQVAAREVPAHHLGLSARAAAGIRCRPVALRGCSVSRPGRRRGRTGPGGIRRFLDDFPAGPRRVARPPQTSRVDSATHAR